MTLKKKELQMPKKKRTLSSLKDFPLEPIYFKWYRYDDTSIFRDILTEFRIKNNLDRIIKLLYAAAEIIRYLDQGETLFRTRLNYFHNEYCKDNPNGPKPTLEKFDDYLYRWAVKVWPRAFDKIHEYRNKHAKR